MAPLLRAALFVAAMPAFAAGAAGIEGRWTTYEDGKPRAVVLVRAHGTAFVVGRIVDFFPKPGEAAEPLCESCKGALRRQPIRGLEILRLEAGGGETWRGTVLDPDEGDVYQAEARLVEGGRRLELRGYVLLPLFGRTETWTRAP